MILVQITFAGFRQFLLYITVCSAEEINPTLSLDVSHTS